MTRLFLYLSVILVFMAILFLLIPKKDKLKRKLEIASIEDGMLVIHLGRKSEPRHPGYYYYMKIGNVRKVDDHWVMEIPKGDK